MNNNNIQKTEDNNIFLNENNLYAILKTKKQVIQIHKLPFSIGRAKDNDLILNHPSISNHHGIIEINSSTNEYFLIDNKSSNGTFINNLKMTMNKTKIETNDKIKFANDETEFIFEKIFNNENDETILFPNYNNNIIEENFSEKISLINKNLQHSKIDHLFGKNENENELKETIKLNENKINDLNLTIKNLELKNNDLLNENKFLKEENEKLKNYNNNLLNEINNLKENYDSNEKQYLFNMNNKLEDINNKIILNKENSEKNLNISNDNLLLKKIKDNLIKNWEILSFEQLSEKIDNIISNYQQKINLNEIILSLQSKYNSEITNFNYILQKNDKKIKDFIEKFNNNNANNYLIKQLNELINEKESNLITINTLRGDLIKLQTNIQIEITKAKNEKIKNNNLINKLNEKILILEKEINNYQKNNNLLLQKQKENEKNFNKTDFNKSFVKTLKQLSEKNKEINNLNKQINNFKEKYSIDASNKNNKFNIENNKNNNIYSNYNYNLFENIDNVQNNTKKLEQLIRLKNKIINGEQ